MTFKYEVMKTAEALAKGYEVSSSRQEDISKQVKDDLLNGTTWWIADSLLRRQDPSTIAAFPWCVARIPLEFQYKCIRSEEAAKLANDNDWAVWYGGSPEVAAKVANKPSLFADERKLSWHKTLSFNILPWAVLRVPAEHAAAVPGALRANYGKALQRGIEASEKADKKLRETTRETDLDRYTKAQREDQSVWLEQSGPSAARASRAWSEDVKAGLKRLEEQRKEEYAQRFPCQGTLPEDLE